MKHRHITTDGWSRMAIDSLVDRGTLADWKEFVDMLRRGGEVARDAIYMCEHHANRDSAALAMVFLEEFYPELVRRAQRAG